MLRYAPHLLLVGAMALGMSAACGKKVTPQSTGGLLSGPTVDEDDEDDTNKRGADRDINDGKTRQGPSGGSNPR
jgi:hypothetical protein